MLRSCLVLAGLVLCAATAVADKRVLVIPEGSRDRVIDPSYEDQQLGLIHPKPPADITIYQHGFGDARPYPQGILLTSPPIRERVIVAFGVFDDDAFGLRITIEEPPIEPLPWMALGGLVTAAGLLFAMQRRRHHPLGALP